MRGQDDAPQAGETGEEGLDIDPAADVPAESAATDPEPSGDQSPEAGPSTSEQPRPNGFLTELQGIDLPTADSGSPASYLPGLNITGDFPTLNQKTLRKSSEVIQLKMINSTQGTVVNRSIRKRAADLNDTDYEGLGYDMALEMHKEKLLDIAYHKEWYKWAEYTAKQSKRKTCLLCSPSPLKKLTVVPDEYSFAHCARFYSNHCVNISGRVAPYCPAECLALLGSKYYHRYYEQEYWGDECRKLDVRIDLRRRETPSNYVFDQTLIYECFNKSKGDVDYGSFQGQCGIIWHLDRDMYENPNVHKAFSRIYATATVNINMTVITTKEACENATLAFPIIDQFEAIDEAIADHFWICGGKRLRATLPKGWKGICARVRLAQEVVMVDWDPDDETPSQHVTPGHRAKRAYKPDPNVVIDAIGQPRGIPHEFKARDEVKSGFESIFVWITPNKNAEWINYIYYNQQRFINYTDDALMALGEQLKYTSKMTWQNRQALNWLLAEKGGVCVMFGIDCCTFIPNNTAPDGSFTKAMKKLKSLRTEVTENAGRDRKIGEWFDSLFGSWKEWLVKVGVIVAVAVGIFVLLFCCVLPFLRSMMAGAAAKQMVNVSVKQSGIDIGCTTTTGVYPIGPGLDELDEFP
ncbi:uncharacterized protein LOC125260187 isoform X2 [Megalobrama amblycephala]|uniref:uncharacterized protein LOC125260187 isoform X2 n=1 Tax=Megalobrama amblycephala TaxID=75352 RepID=UPI0020143DC6|nr:uncharacterized protein LOC125260187 isoform X2 [Megalobrama amblycephala]